MTPRSRAMYTDDATNGRQQSTHVRFSCCVNTSRKMACTSEEHARRTFATTIDPASLLLSSTALSSAGAPPMSAPGSTVEAGGAACPRRRSLRLARGDPTATSGALLPATVPARRKLASAPVKSCKANATSAACGAHRTRAQRRSTSPRVPTTGEAPHSRQSHWCAAQQACPCAPAALRVPCLPRLAATAPRPRGRTRGWCAGQRLLVQCTLAFVPGGPASRPHQATSAGRPYACVRDRW
eukprot:m.478717 g.478717  ORF g.478717 m.478717 type:complete len:240 (+) comp21694_c0_seq23:294-1013(+)